MNANTDYSFWGYCTNNNYYITRLVYYLKQVLFRVNSRELFIEW